jgi:hypothetical protein
MAQIVAVERVLDKCVSYEISTEELSQQKLSPKLRGFILPVDWSENVFYEEVTTNTPLREKFDSIYYETLFANLRVVMKECYNDYNFYIFCICQGKQNLLPKSANCKTDKKKVLIYICDEANNDPHYLLPYYHAIFKNYLSSNEFEKHKIFNFPLWCPDYVSHLPYKNINERKYSVFFSGNLSYPRLSLFFVLLFGKTPNIIFQKVIKKMYFKFKFIRKMLTLLKFDSKFQKAFIRFTNGFNQGLPGEEYGKILSESKIVLCPMGYVSPECYRHYEAMRAGCVIISEKRPPTYFYKDSPIIQVSDWNEGLKINKDLINNEKELERRSKATIDWWENRCNEKATANYMAKCLEFLEEEKLTYHQ